MQAALWFLNVGYGDAFYAEVFSDDGEPFRLLVDGGSATRADSLLALLQERCVSTLDLLISTHLHEDHVAGLALAAKQLMAVKECWALCPLPDAAVPLPIDPTWAYYTGKTGESLNAYRWLLQERLPALGARLLTAAAGDLAPGMAFEPVPGLRLEVLYTGGAKTAATVGMIDRLYREPAHSEHHLYQIDQSANEACLALRLQIGDLKVLLPGDNLLGWWQAVPPEQLQADLLKIAHHGAADATSAELIALVKPQAAILSCSLARTDRPEPAVLEALGPVPLHQTEFAPYAQAIAVTWDGHQITISHKGVEA
ncbi:MAG TPA: MBL fold metallo-hydrolase [Symbiobacteriaceae bacterium]|nr:MBL fold metallo-hydrolase [Symbiobacteriaceae bacterium]